MSRRTSLGERLVPSLLVRDLVETLEFYSRLGFRRTGIYPLEGEAVWAEVQRDGVTLQFHTQPPAGTPPEPVCSGTFYFYPESVRAMAEELPEQIEPAWGPEVMDYGMLEMGIRDPNGYFLAFTEPVVATTGTEPNESGGV